MDKQLRALSDLRVWERNYNEGDIGAISTSIAAFGYNRSISVWRDGIVIAGNHTLLALQWLYKQQVDAPTNVQVIDGEWWIQVSDASHLTDEEATAYAIADNRTAALANPDMEALTTLLQEVAKNDDELLQATSYTGDDLDEMLRALSIPENGTWAEALSGLPDSDRSPFQQMTFTLHDEQIEIVKQALGVARQEYTFDDTDNENSNGNALAQICSNF